MTDTPDTLRLFFALWPDEQTRLALTHWQDVLHSVHGGRRMQPQTLHLTLAFLGDVPPSLLPAIHSAARGLTVAPCELVLSRAQLWPHNRIVHAAPDHTPDALTRLVASLRSRLHTENIPCDSRPWTPHVTLLRNAHEARSTRPYLPPIPWKLDHFVLLRSRPDAQGAHYETIAQFG